MAHAPTRTELHVVSFVGLRGQQPRLIQTDDTVWIHPSEEHWHGATASDSVAHIAIQKSLDRHLADWLEKMSDEEYSLREN